MTEKKYRFITSTKQFETDNIGSDYLKEEDGVFYARQNTNEGWFRLYKIEKRTSALEKWNNWSFLLGLLGYVGGFGLILSLIPFIEHGKSWSIQRIAFFVFFVFWLYGGGFYILNYIGGLIEKALKNSPSYFVQLSNNKIRRIIEKEKLSSINSHKSNSSHDYRKISYSGGSYYGNSSINISSNDLNKAIKDFESKGKNWESLVNNTTDEEREKLFTEYFHDKAKGQIANAKFNREQAGPARKQTLNKILEESEYEDEETKGHLAEKINNLDESISDDVFQVTAKEIRLYQERKRQKDNHIKYEGRLSNKDIQEIKEHLGYVCMGCGLDPVEEYGSKMKGILEAHHKNPWAEMKENEARTVKPDDFYILCPTCHRMIHRLASPDDLDGLKKVLNQNKHSSWWE